jgi:hypothetical protein
MGKRSTSSGNISLSPKLDPRRDKSVILPQQVKHAAAVADALVTGRPVPAKPRFPHSDEKIDRVLQCLRAGALQVGDPEFDVVRDLAEEGARRIKSSRRGARGPRKKSNSVTQRMQALLRAFKELSPKRQAHPMGTMTIQDLRQSLKKLGLTASEDTIRRDLQQMGDFLPLVRKGNVPRPQRKPVNPKA